MCLNTQIEVTNHNNNNYHLTHSFNQVTSINTMETGSHVAQIPNTCSPRLAKFGQHLEPLLPGKDNKRKRLNAVLDKLASNITKVSDDGPGDDLDSPDKGLEFEINVKTKFKKDESEDTSGDSDDNIAGDTTDCSSPNKDPTMRLSLSSPIKTNPGEGPLSSAKSTNNTFFNTLLLNSPKCDKKQETSPVSSLASQSQPTSPSIISSYEEYVLKTHLLSKMYLQQYCAGAGNGLGLGKTPPHNVEPSNSQKKEKPKKNGDSKVHQNAKRKEKGSLLDSPLDLSTRTLETEPTPENLTPMSIKDGLYPPHFPFASLQQMLLQSNMTQEVKPSRSPPPVVVKTEKKLPAPKPSQPPPPHSSPSCTNVDGKKDLSYVCPICGQMFSLHDRLAKHMASRHKSKPVESSSKAYFCDVCKRSFARSDMLTRHMRLHTGIKPYTCRVCGQVFSRSDHLSTHQRTHTGEKPYKCPSCPYSACRRDMITRHMRTHSRYELPDTSAIATQDLQERVSKRESNGHSIQFVKEELVDS